MDTLEESLINLNLLEKGLKEIVEEELVMLRGLNPDILAEVHNGFVVYKLGDANFALATVHNGSYVPEGVELKQTLEERKKEEDLFTGELYLPLFLEKGGIWINSHISRYFVDLNRDKFNSILCYNSDSSGTNLTEGDEDEVLDVANQFYNDFYKKSMGVVSGKFLFSGHSMNSEKNGEKRGDFCLIYKTDEAGISLKQSLEKQGFDDVRINNPFGYQGGHYRFYFDLITEGSVEFETNKRLYLDDNLKKSTNFNSVSKRISKAVIDSLII